MKDRRKKIFLMSIVMFLVISGGLYFFFMMKALSDIKARSYIIATYSPFKRAILPVLKYFNFVENDLKVPSRQKKDEEIPKFGDDVIENMVDMNDNANVDNKNNHLTFSPRKPFIPDSKLSHSLSGDIPSGSGSVGVPHPSGGTLKNRVSQSFSNTVPKGISVSKQISDNNSLKQSFAKPSTVISRLEETKVYALNALKNQSADGGRLDLERAFTGSIKPTGKMLYSGNAVELDRVKGKISDLKFTDEKGLKAPEVGAKLDKEASSKQKNEQSMKDLMKEMFESIMKDMTNSIINPAIGTVNSVNPITLDQLPPKVKEQLDYWAIEGSSYKYEIQPQMLYGELAYVVRYLDDPENFQMILDSKGDVLLIKTSWSNGWIGPKYYCEHSPGFCCSGVNC